MEQPCMNPEGRAVPACPLCDVPSIPRRTLPARIGEFPISIGRCPRCGLVMQSPRVTQEESSRYMEWRWSSSAADDKYVTDTEGRLREGMARAALLKTLRLPGDTVLDVGAGSGAFCAAAIKLGFKPTGVEPTRSGVERASRAYGVDLICGTTDAIPPVPAFAAVTLWDVIEHLRDPVSVLEECRKRLLPGGAVIVETGNYESTARLLAGNRWALYLFDHMFYFTPDSLSRIMERAGFRDFALHPEIEDEAPSVARKPVGRLRKAITRARQFPAKLQGRIRWPKHHGISLMVASARI